MATRPATAPDAAPTTLGRLPKIQDIPTQANTAAAVAVLVTTNALVARPSAGQCADDEDDNGAELHSLRKRARYQGWRNDREHRLEDHEGLVRYGIRVWPQASTAMRSTTVGIMPSHENILNSRGDRCAGCLACGRVRRI